MYEQHFRFVGYTEERLWAARWHLFEVREVRNVFHLYADIVSVVYDGEPRTEEWLALLRGRGYEFEPLVRSDPELAA
jgi:hypothetical protein